MKLSKIRYGRTYNLGNYQSARFEAEGDLEDDENPDDAWMELFAQVDHARLLAEKERSS